MNIGKSVVIKGELNGSEDLTIEGHVEGKIELKDHVLTIGPNGKIKASVFAKSVIVLGEVNGNVTASEKVDIRDGGSVDGDIVSPRVAIAEGAHFRGTVDMQKKGASGQQKARRRAAACRSSSRRSRWPSPSDADGGAPSRARFVIRDSRIVITITSRNHESRIANSLGPLRPVQPSSQGS